MSMMAAFATQTGDGDRSNPLEGDYFAQAFISRKFQAFDLDLYNTKWFDYRFLTPFEATKAYIDAYGDVYRDIYSRERDRNRAEHIKPLDFERIKEGLDQNKTKAKRQFTGCWRGRQFADAIGIPYANYIELAFTYRMRAWSQPYLPQPEHLYHEFDLESIQNRWEQLQSSRIWTSEHPAYMVQNYAHAPIQDDYHEWLFKQASLRSGSGEFLARFVSEDRLPIQKVRARLSDDRELEDFEYYHAQS